MLPDKYGCMNTDFWIDGITASIIVLMGLLLTPFFFLRYKKSNALLLKKFAFISPLAGLIYLGVFLDFVFILITKNNIPNNYGQVALLSYIWFPALMFVFLTFLMELLSVKSIRKIQLVIIIIAVIYYIIIFSDPYNSFYWVAPDIPGSAMIDYNSNLASPAGIILAILFIPSTLYISYLFIKISINSPSEIKKRFILCACGGLAFCLGGIGEGLTVPGSMLIIIRLLYIFAFIFIYFGIKNQI